jgi:hypothetical protein
MKKDKFDQMNRKVLSDETKNNETLIPLKSQQMK